MSLFDSFTRPKWQHQDPEVRKLAIGETDDQELLLELLKTDPDTGVQSLALSKITSPDTLDKLIETLPPALQQQSRSQRLQQLLPDPEQIGTISDDAVLLRIAGLTDNPELSAAAIAGVNSSGLLLDIASKHPVAKVRLNAALGIEDIELLSELKNRSRGHDKAVYRHCKSLLDEHHARQRTEEERQERIKQLADKARDLAKAVDSPEYKGRYQLLSQQWQTVSAWASPEQTEQFQCDLVICGERLANHSQTRAADEQRQSEISDARLEFPAIIGELEHIDGNTTQAEDFATIKQLRTVLEDLDSRWQAASKVTPPSSEQTRALRQYTDRSQSILKTSHGLIEKKPRLDKILREAERADSSDYEVLQRKIKILNETINSLPWPESHQASLPAPITQLKQALTRLKEQLSALEQSREKHIEQLKAALGKLSAELDQDHMKNADQAHSKARRALKTLAPALRQQYEHELRPLAARLHEVHDWQGFAIEPKKEALCARMKDLIGSEENPGILAETIKSLQLEWKQLGALPHSREQVLWNEFKAAADEAWEPCKAAQAKQAVLQRENYKKRMQLVAQLKNYDEKMAWPDAGNEDSDISQAEETDAEDSAAYSAPDWKMVQKTLDTAREAFRNIKPVSQKDERRSQKAFRAICNRIYQHIKDEYGNNISLKEELVTSVQALVEMEDMRQAIDKVKRLQRDWKEIGMTPVGADRKLWKEFRAACDGVFNRLDKQRDQSKAEIDARVKQAESFRDQARLLLDSEDEDRRLHIKKYLSELRLQFLEIELPRGAQQRLSRDFQEIERKVQEAIDAKREQKELERWNFLLEKIKAGALKSEDEDTATSRWEQAGDLPKGIDANTLEAFWQQGPDTGNGEQLREACIALEILGEIESPPADKEARMNYQMKRLVEGMGSQQTRTEMVLETRINDFVALQPTPDWADRFCSVVEKIRK